MVAKTLRVKIKKNDFLKLARLAPAEADKAIRALAQEGVNIVKASMLDSPATGLSYRRGSKTHVASSPGSAPRPDSGTLINTIQAVSRGQAKQAVVAGTEYAKPQEFGSGARNLAPRPFMGPMSVEVEGLVPIVFDHFLEDQV